MSLPPVAILAGGLATRLQPIATTLPKAMVCVAGAPFIDWQLRLLRREGAHVVVLCLGHLGAQIADYVGDGGRYGLEVRYSHDSHRPGVHPLLGTGGALRKALPLLGPEFLILYGDSYLDLPYAPIVANFRASGRDGQMTVFCNKGRFDTSNVVFEGGRLVFYSKKFRRPDMCHIDYGLGMLKARALLNYPPAQAFDLADVFSDLLSTGQLVGHEVHRRFYEIGQPEGLAETEAYLHSLESTVRSDPATP